MIQNDIIYQYFCHFVIYIDLSTWLKIMDKPRWMKSKILFSMHISHHLVHRWGASRFNDLVSWIDGRDMIAKVEGKSSNKRHETSWNQLRPWSFFWLEKIVSTSTYWYLSSSLLAPLLVCCGVCVCVCVWASNVRSQWKVGFRYRNYSYSNPYKWIVTCEPAILFWQILCKLGRFSKIGIFFTELAIAIYRLVSRTEGQSAVFLRFSNQKMSVDILDRSLIMALTLLSFNKNMCSKSSRPHIWC